MKKEIQEQIKRNNERIEEEQKKIREEIRINKLKKIEKLKQQEELKHRSLSFKFITNFLSL